MAATANPPTKAVTEWCKVFHAQGTESYTSSVTFMKQLTVVAVSIITYMKNAFPEESYTNETFAGLKLRILKKKCEDELAQFLSSSLTQAFDALDKKYLHQLAICFYEDECKSENLIEYHMFEYSYNTEGVSLNIHSKTRNSKQTTTKCTFDDVKEKTTQLIRACIVMMQAQQEEVPPGADISVRLYYTDDAPEDYQAPGFLPSWEQLDTSRGIQLGRVTTPHHQLTASCSVRAALSASRQALATQSPPEITATQGVDFNGSSRSESASPAPRLRCPCNNYDGGDRAPLITCSYCSSMQHAACFGILDAHVAKLKQHVCAECAEQWRLTPTDPSLGPLSVRKRECLCIFRRTLHWCTQLTHIEGSRLAARFKISAGNAAKLMKLLHSYKIVDLEPGTELTTPKKINNEHLLHQISKYFKGDDGESDIADRLMAETFASQESNQADPVGDVLSPLEKISLQNATNIGHVIENTEVHTKNDDPTLRQYREAIMSSDNNCEEMPLAGSNVVNLEGIGANVKKSVKRKAEGIDAPVGKRLRSGVRNKKKNY